MGEVQYRQLENTDDARDAYRFQQATEVRRQVILQEAEVDALKRLREELPSAIGRFGGESIARQSDLGRLRRQAQKLEELAGIESKDVDWRSIAAFIDQLLAQEEELHVRALDQAANVEAYGLTDAEAKYQLAKSEARVKAFQDARDRLEDRIKGKEVADVA